MEEYFSGGDYYTGGVEKPGFLDVVYPWRWDTHCWLVAIFVAFVVCMVWYFTLVGLKYISWGFKNTFSNKEGLRPGMYAIRDDTGFPNTDSLHEQARRERLIESGREPNLHHPDPVELATQLALRAGGQATNLNDQETTENEELKAAMAANAAAGAAQFRNRFTERMTPEEEVRAKQAAMAGL